MRWDGRWRGAEALEGPLWWGRKGVMVARKDYLACFSSRAVMMRMMVTVVVMVVMGEFELENCCRGAGGTPPSPQSARGPLLVTPYLHFASSGVSGGTTGTADQHSSTLAAGQTSGRTRRGPCRTRKAVRPAAVHPSPPRLGLFRARHPAFLGSLDVSRVEGTCCPRGWRHP